MKTSNRVFGESIFMGLFVLMFGILLDYVVHALPLKLFVIGFLGNLCYEYYGIGEKYSRLYD